MVCLPTDQKFDVIYADPPWQRYNSAPSRAEGYSLMDLDAIKDMDIASISNKDSVLYLWATAPMMPEAVEVMRAWGYEYKTCFVWVKDKIGLGWWCRNRHEILMVGKRGAFKTPSPEMRPDSVLEYPRRRHSQKPPEVARMLEELYPDLSKIELFCRDPREGWTTWGNEVENGKRIGFLF